MINDWRQKWNKPNLPFYYAQLANFRDKKYYDQESLWAVLRDAQLHALAIPHTGMAVLADIGDAQDIHPKNKQEVGRRLGLIARNRIYKQNVDYTGPILKSWRIKNSTIILNFDADLKDFIGKNNSAESSFYVSGKDNKYYPAQLKVVKNSIILSSEFVHKPNSVRYGWSDNPELVLYNKAGLPTSPFSIEF